MAGEDPNVRSRVLLTLRDGLFLTGRMERREAGFIPPETLVYVVNSLFGRVERREGDGIT